VKNASVSVQDETIGEIAHGLTVLLGVSHEDTIEDAKYLVNKIIHLRIFEDENNRMNRSLIDVGGSVLSISQFTLYGDTKKGRRPSFIHAAKPDEALWYYEQFNQLIKEQGIHVETGKFGEMMNVQLINSGPVTLIIDSKER
jgi:D-tyrosyl-tRNA(Tyr) deacylase